MSKTFTALDATALRQRYGSFYRVTTSALDPAGVPAGLRDLLPYAELWGMGDDVERDELADAAPAAARDDLKALFAARNDAFDDWLAGPEADGPEFSPEYIAFSNMRIAFDYLNDE